MHDHRKPSRRELIGTGVAAAVVSAAAGATMATRRGVNMTGEHDFAFQTGDWRVRHRKLRGRLVGSSEWVDFDGSCRAWEVMDGHGNVDDHLIGDPAGAYRAATFRQADPNTGEWSIWWFDPRQLSLDPPVKGRFDGGVGTFLADDRLRDQPIKVRFVWSGIAADAARWEQAFSGDGGRTWEVNWTMRFERVA